MPEEHRHLWRPSPTSTLGKTVQLDLPGGFTTRHGGCLPAIQVCYESWGELNAAGDNAVLIVHLLTSDPHVTGNFAGQPEGWWERLVGPGLPIDTDRNFVVCPNLIGGCHGTTGPRFPDDGGEPYLERFPLLAPVDMMRVQRLFLKQLGINRLRAVVGASMGGMIAWEWAVEGGDDVELVVVVAAPLRTTALQIGLNWLQRRGIELDINGTEEAARWGQMVARGVGMLSYRSPVGLEEKFGREWFRPPGPLLKDRGMFNVESWLRFHGRRSATSFDPYTYILFTRAMDLHDVGEGRGGIIGALDRVRCRTLVVGISSDSLYPAAQVHLGADILNNLGKTVEYAEIRSPHGHDALLLETGQLGEILRDADIREPREVPSAARREVRPVRIGILGAGRVAALFVRLLDERRDQVAEEFGLGLEVAGVADIDSSRAFDPVFDAVGIDFDPARLVERDDIDVVVELTRGTSSLPLLEAALRRRRPVVTTNKALVRESGSRLEQIALEHGVRLAYHNAIAAGWPLLHAVERPLGRGRAASIHAVLSATCNVMLERMEQGFSYGAALSHAIGLGIAEPDPMLDVSGWDTAQKLLMLVARTERHRYTVEDIEVTGIENLDPVVVRGAGDLGLRVKLVGLFVRRPPKHVAGVLPIAVPAEGHLGGVRGENNVIVLAEDEEGRGTSGEMVHLGNGAGSLPIATAALNDVVGLFNASRSWTGRYPRFDHRPDPPRFSHHLARERGAMVITDTPGPATVPLLRGQV
jgi:homoserine O-acetyltransferase/O-succinyltransferase